MSFKILQMFVPELPQHLPVVSPTGKNHLLFLSRRAGFGKDLQCNKHPVDMEAVRSVFETLVVSSIIFGST